MRPSSGANTALVTTLVWRKVGERFAIGFHSRAVFIEASTRLPSGETALLRLLV